MQVKCAWCKATIEGDANDPVVSHGICQKCRDESFPARIMVTDKRLARTAENSIGWSARREWIANGLVIGGLCGAAGALAGFAISLGEYPILSTVMLIISGVAFVAGSGIHLGMSANRPKADAAQGTKFSRITRADEAAFRFITPMGNLMLVCKSCGRWLTLRETDWYANPIDEGGGRYAKVCQCGQGYWCTKEILAKARASCTRTSITTAVSRN